MKVKLKNLQVIRGLAALMVVLVHAHSIITSESKNEIIRSFRGYLGVPIFFIISGFIMVFTTEKQSESVKSNIREFLLKRIFRIVPLFYFAILIYFAINMYNPLSFIRHNLDMMGRMMLFVPFFSDKLGPFYGVSFLYVNWSLNYEMMFYAVFGLSLLFRKLRYVFLYFFFLVMIFVFPILSVGYFTYNYSVYYNFKVGFINFFTNPISFLFIIGTSFGLLIKNIKLSKLIIGVFSIMSILLFIVYFFSLIPSSYAIDTLLCSLLVLSVLLLDFNIHEINPPRVLTYLGDISYSIYLMHPLVFIILLKLTKTFEIREVSNSWYFLLFAYIIVILISALTFEIIEKRFTVLLKNWFLDHK